MGEKNSSGPLEILSPAKLLDRSKAYALEYLLRNENFVGRGVILSKALNRLVPFNAPHGFVIEHLSEDQVRVSLPSRRSNWNHLNSVHACAIATLGEMVAGLSILHMLGISNHRLILKSLAIDYIKQATTNLEGVATLSLEEQNRVKEELATDHLSSITINSKVYNNQSELVAKIESCWQLKNWDYVTFKSL
ncbi:MAG: DUF4442 domain-containing protein [Bdellovibrionales bacterium]|jgi:acyl-coenzyme A thioesterase PaaI-like protein|nr:DUF4442 domain-containing protein [Bdellovibrionales bacterium]MBT3525879.1 DUF4442 domain-containing protein [Bdellovibrionales bacterium]MBT7668232.1 DUF4442 domain-containing protein [Bdellovibrionales bacterium]MBT7767756.1 DUF4442 domain-containing protein [Bdellovibrionales bacterium]